MASEGEDDRRGKRKMIEPRDKQMPHRGCGRTTGGSSSAVGRGDANDRGRRDQLIQEEENLERAAAPFLQVLAQILHLTLRSLTEVTSESILRK